MSVRSNILAVLTLGPAYGLQLHSEIEARTCRAGAINVGQIYSTLNRLVDSGLVVAASQTDDRLPLYELTAVGRIEAQTGLGAPFAGSLQWADMMQHVLLAASLPDVDLPSLLTAYETAWRDFARRAVADDAADTDAVDAQGLRLAGDRFAAAGALDWLEQVRCCRENGGLVPRGLSGLRPRRGRRPSVA